MPPQLNLGQIDYLNCRPLYQQLQEALNDNFYTLRPGHPTQLNQGLENGTIDISPSSSMLLAVSPKNDYFILPDIAITSLNEVRSVLLLSRRPLSELNGCNISLTGHSLTSIFLLKIILFHFQGLNPDKITFTTNEFDPNQTREAALIIGDQALGLYHNPPTGFRVYDLGSLWHQFTGLPFVYALWIGRKEILPKKNQAVTNLHQHLTEIVSLLPGKLANLAAATFLEKDKYSAISSAQLLAYWEQAISYKLDNRALAGLDLFYQTARGLGLIDKVPQLDFFPKPNPA
ncbi:MAG: menaquinone biosynthesis protein [Deltaproteobacteria bacterium]|nr:menaquinone biosynthesis protein [Candidatus Tharpella aukensis]